MFYNSSLFSQHQSSLLTLCTSHIFNKDGNDSFLCIAFLSTSITIALLPPVVVAGNAMIWAAVWRKILWGHHFIYLWVVWFFTDLCTGIVAQPFYSDVFNEFNNGLRLAKTPYSLVYSWRGKWDVFYCCHRKTLFGFNFAPDWCECGVVQVFLD